MFLSRIELNPKRFETRKAFASPQIFHAAVEGCFDEQREKTRKLWRIDKLDGRLYLLVLSPEIPDFTRFSAQFCSEETMGETKSYARHLTRIQEGQRLRFRLRANPVHSAPDKKDKSGRGKVFAHVTIEQKLEWLRKKAPACGFMLTEGGVEIVETGRMRFWRTAKKRAVEIDYAVFEGELEVTDPERFTEALIRGIGRAKAYGCGLMTVTGAQ